MLRGLSFRTCWPLFFSTRNCPGAKSSTGRSMSLSRPIRDDRKFLMRSNTRDGLEKEAPEKQGIIVFQRDILKHPETAGWCPLPDSNRHSPLGPRDFKSLVSTNSTKRAEARWAPAGPGWNRCSSILDCPRLSIRAGLFAPFRAPCWTLPAIHRRRRQGRCGLTFPLRRLMSEG